MSVRPHLSRETPYLFALRQKHRSAHMVIAVNMAHIQALEVTKDLLDPLFTEMPSKLVIRPFTRIKQNVSPIRYLDQRR